MSTGAGDAEYCIANCLRSRERAESLPCKLVNLSVIDGTYYFVICDTRARGATRFTSFALRISADSALQAGSLQPNFTSRTNIIAGKIIRDTRGRGGGGGIRDTLKVFN
jgi:hypothetical protein